MVYRLCFVSYWFIFDRQGTTSNVHWSLINDAEFDRKWCCVMIFSDWRITDHHAMQEAKLLNILHCLEHKQRETYWTEKLGEQLPISLFSTFFFPRGGGGYNLSYWIRNLCWFFWDRFNSIYCKSFCLEYKTTPEKHLIRRTVTQTTGIVR